MTTTSFEYRRDIDGLRAVAVLAVLLFHLDVRGFGGGFVGVDIFFVISGYLITGLIYRQREAGSFSFADFYARRARRLFPAMFVTVALTFILGALLMSPVAFRYLSSSAIAAALSVSNITFWLESGYFDPSKWTKPLLHTWSLGVEEQFYLIWPAAMILLIARGSKRTLLIAIAAAGIASIVLTEITQLFNPAAAFFLLPFRVSEFAIGALLVFAPKLSPDERITFEDSAFLLGVVSIAASVILFDTGTRFPGFSALLPCAGAALCIYFGQSTVAAYLLGNPAAVWVGRISYSLYLVHWPVIVFAKYYLLRELSSLEAVLALAASFALAYPLYRFVELRFRLQGAAKSNVRPGMVGAIIAGSILLLAAPAFTGFLNGWAWRVTDGPAFVDRRQLHNTYYGGVNCKSNPCETTGNPAHPKIYVIGDSHARGLYAGLARAFPDINFVIFAPDACEFYAKDYYVPDPKFGRGRCAALQKRAFDEIKASNAPVIFFQFWRWYAQLPHLPEAGGQTFRATDPSSFARFVSAQLNAVTDELGNRHVAVIGGVPTFASIGSPLDCLSRPFQRPPCTTSSRLTQADKIHASFNRTISALPDKKFAWIDPFEYLCDPERCRNMTADGKTLYSDSDHISEWGSEYFVSIIWPAIAREFKKALSAR